MIVSFLPPTKWFGAFLIRPVTMGRAASDPKRQPETERRERRNGRGQDPADNSGMGGGGLAEIA